MGFRIASSALVAAFFLASGGRAAEPFSYDEWTRVLEARVDAQGLVDYDGLARDRADLDRFLAAVAEKSPTSHPALFPTRNHELAYWVNAYNALVFHGVLARGPERKSVWTGGLVSGYSFFVGTDIVLGGVKTNLRALENGTIREGFRDPRIHAALNCASRSCPRLPRKAFDPGTLDAELDAAMAEFVAGNRNVSVDPVTRTVRLSKIFDWFERDFLDFETSRGSPDPSLIDYVNRYRGTLPAVPRDHRIRFFPYDKALNRR